MLWFDPFLGTLSMTPSFGFSVKLIVSVCGENSVWMPCHTLRTIKGNLSSQSLTYYRFSTIKQSSPRQSYIKQ